MKQLVQRLSQNRHLERSEYLRLLAGCDHELLKYINECARVVAMTYFGKAVYVRGLIELTNYCRNNCYYCGIRKANSNVARYRLEKEQVLECCRLGDSLRIRTFVLQGGEDSLLDDAFMQDLIKSIRRDYHHTAITLSLGERSKDSYQALYKAGANRYLLRHETANPQHYASLHPANMSPDNRKQCLRNLKQIGFQTGAGMMVGTPGQTLEHLVDDLLFLEEIKPHMIGLGPFIPQQDTPFAHEPSGSVEITLLLISILRLMFPKALIPATTALATLAKDGYERGILAGANVIMPNLLPIEYKTKYIIYDGKEAIHITPQEQYKDLKRRIESIRYYLSDSRGDYP
ncbi:MAG: [FeFe] hydrogenase H-cluster radical SAM maturase HydE [Bacteroides sp.]|nr:[FeFe] hydrogenase H-cluster radical SAM maturase HydE [Bacteroides sp.]